MNTPNFFDQSSMKDSPYLSILLIYHPILIILLVEIFYVIQMLNEIAH